jgi:ATP-binding cassette subfamily B (MDR/TAP) protein 1
MPDYAKARSSINSMFDLFERVPKINNLNLKKGEIIQDKDFNGKIQLNQIEFTYPSRPDAKILRGLDLSIEKGQRVALVGSSGCGKTSISLFTLSNLINN